MHHQLDFQGHKIQVYDEGKGEAIVFLHGWPTNAKLWQEQTEALRTNFRVIRPEWLGFGGSDKPEQHTYSFSNMKATLDLVLNTLLEKDEALNIVVHDIGGPAGLLWASEHQERVKRLVLLNTVLYPLKTPLDAFSERLMHTPIAKSIFVSRLGLNLVLATNTRSRGPKLRARIKSILAAYDGVGEAVKLKTLTEPVGGGREAETPELSKRFHNLSVPRYLVIADKDPLLFAHIQKLSEENPEVPVHKIENCGHFIPIDRPEALNQILLNILSD